MPTVSTRSLWLAYILLASTNVGVAGGVLAWLGGQSLAEAILVAGASFATATTLGVLLSTFLSQPTSSATVTPPNQIQD